MRRHDALNIVDRDRYPLDDTGSSAYRDLVSDTRARLASGGCAVLGEFVRPDRISDLIAEADAVAAKGHRSFSRTNAYFTKDDIGLPASHPQRRFYDRSNAFVPADNFGPDSILRGIYE